MTTPAPTSDPGPSDPRLAPPLALLLHHASVALRAVRAGRSLDDALAQAAGDAPPAVRAATQALTFHALRGLGAAQAARARLAARTPPPEVDALLCVALTQLWPAPEPAQSPAQSPAYAPHTLVDQAVQCATRHVPRSAGFVNAVLRRFLRERPTLVKGLLEEDPVARHNHPRWWIDSVRSDWPRQWEAVLAAANRHPPMSLRVNARRTGVADYLQQLERSGIAAVAAGGQAVVLASPRPVHDLPGFAQGLVSVQDVSAQLAAPLLLGEGAERLASGARVLDACAAPGGKTAHLLELAELDVLALDRDPARLPRVTQNLERLGLSAQVLEGDATQPATWWDGRPFDAVLVDAPCSASGIVRRHPDIRWLRRPADIAALARVQHAMLEACWPLLRPGGRLVYATCSVFRSEGERQVEAFLQRNPDAIRRPAPGHLLPLDNPAEGAAVEGDGFFYARIDKPD